MLGLENPSVLTDRDRVFTFETCHVNKPEYITDGT